MPGQWKFGLNIVVENINDLRELLWDVATFLPSSAIFLTIGVLLVAVATGLLGFLSLRAALNPLLSE
ncbi:hypothetical protein [Natrinema ejinorense]|uniref:Uncharacterized protein n=1 Tax=Natrinema ejinorense TaxID=373386 RepID=A0A2A5QS03_9EURY|nr:hypothetical protein [Natrinema ejinorense]PCR89584.1 hypothetical protein CP557_02970 [Natrinema ejinorense]